MTLSPRAMKKIREHLVRQTPTREIVFEVPDGPDVRAKIEQFAMEHVARHVFVLRRGDWNGAKLLAGLTAVPLGHAWRIRATMVEQPNGVALPMCIFRINRVLRAVLAPSKGK